MRDDDTATVEVDLFTDPLCSWSWAFEAPSRRLRLEFGPSLRWRIRLGGMIPDWATYADPVNSVSAASQMGPHWLHVEASSGMPVDARLWHEDPPESSLPACLAVKAAALQGPRAEEAMLRRLREAAMLERRNVGRAGVLEELAGELGGILDAQAWVEDFHGPTAADALREDLRETRYRGFGRFPTVVLRRAGARRGLLLVGYRPYEALRDALAHVAPELSPPEGPASFLEFARHWGSVVPHELAVATGTPAAEVEPRVLEEAAAGRLHLAFLGTTPGRSRWIPGQGERGRSV